MLWCVEFICIPSIYLRTALSVLCLLLYLLQTQTFITYTVIVVGKSIRRAVSCDLVDSNPGEREQLLKYQPPPNRHSVEAELLFSSEHRMVRYMPYAHLQLQFQLWSSFYLGLFVLLRVWVWHHVRLQAFESVRCPAIVTLWNCDIVTPSSSVSWSASIWFAAPTEYTRNTRCHLILVSSRCWW